MRTAFILLTVVVALAAANTCWIDMAPDIDFQHNTVPGNQVIPGTFKPTFDACKDACANAPGGGCIVVHWCDNAPINGGRAGECWAASKIDFKARGSGCNKATNARVGACPAPCPAGSGCSATKRYTNLGTSETTWASARDQCRDAKGRLPTFENADETQAFLDMAVANNLPNSYRPWIGYGDSLNQYTFRVMDGLGAHENNYQGRLISTGNYANVNCQVSYCNWHANNPSGDGRKGEILYFVGGGGGQSGQWNDVNENWNRNILCEYDYLPIPTTQDPAVAAFCDDIADKCTAMDAECTTIRNGQGPTSSGTMSNQAGDGGIGEQTGGVTLYGNSAVVTASGNLFCGPGCPNAPDGNPVPATATFLLPGVNKASLIARVGAGPWQFVGAGPTTITGHGALTFAFNDLAGGYGDNSGSWDIVIKEDVAHIADDCDASVAACNDMVVDCQSKAASCPLV